MPKKKTKKKAPEVQNYEELRDELEARAAADDRQEYTPRGSHDEFRYDAVGRMPAAVVKTPPTGVYDLSHNGRAGREKTISPSYETENSNVKFAAGFQTQVPQALPDGTPTQDALEGVMQDIMAYTHGEPDAVIGGVSSREYARPTSAGEVPHARGTINVNEDTSRFTPRYAEAYEEAKQGPAMMLQHMSKRLDEMGIDHPPFRDLTSMRKWVRGLHYDLSKQRRLAGPDYVQADQSE